MGIDAITATRSLGVKFRDDVCGRLWAITSLPRSITCLFPFLRLESDCGISSEGHLSGNEEPHHGPGLRLALCPAPFLKTV